MEPKTLYRTTCRIAVLLLLPFAAGAEDAIRTVTVTPGGGVELVPLLIRLMPWLPPGVIAAGVAIANASLLLVLAGLGTSHGWRIFKDWQQRNSPPRTSPARRAPRRSQLPPAHVSAKVRVADAVERARQGDDEARRKRIRDRFVYVRFDGALKGTADFNVPSKVIKAARLYFEDGRGDRSEELLALALKHRPEEHAYWLARLEIRFLLGDAKRFVEVAEAFQKVAPDASEWDEIKRLGVRIAPESMLFAGHASNAADTYGPWPTMPNWIQSSWDLTAEVIASEFHHRMRDHIQEMRETFAHGAALATQ